MELDAPMPSSAEIEALSRRIDRSIVLVGMMGVGKSTVGRKLANALHFPFVDADEAIEQAAQMTIPEIFEHYGEASFRDGERRVIARLMGESQPKVIATGGGAFCNPETRQLILDRGITVWLDSDIDVLVERVGRKDNRPLLRQGDPREILTRLKAEREPFYSQAPIHVKSGNVPHSHALAAVLKEIDAWL
ncbi:shikimate kinase [Novosphingobium sp. TH158]|uniref:shikimate kinase n=1 Tax=Novosphingobium sp. TH158 TaxID=2067455 RepID=UPI000C799E4E|nr:shikimate kinase [Novosphingobium sp. TH158]PLK26107.1 shikimate kinase [Novosphingobium sp. TH158]